MPDKRLTGNGISRPRVLIAQRGARRHYAVPRAFEQAGMLARFQTDAAANHPLVQKTGQLLPAFLKRGPVRRLLDRTVPGIPHEKIDSFPLFALREALASRLRRSQCARYRGYAAGNHRFGKRLVRSGADGADTVYVFNGAGLELLGWAREHGRRTVVDQTMAPVEVVEGLLAEERQRWPGWEAVMTPPACWRALADREAAEWAVADRIICGSEFVAHSVREAGGPGERCVVVPYPCQAAPAMTPPNQHDSERLRALFVGTVELRKGVPYLAEAARMLEGQRVVMRAVGAVQVAPSAARRLGEWLELIGPVARSQIEAHYRWADVVVLPSIAEGSANVCYEALARGLPVITTPNAGSVVRDGQDGYVVPIRSGEALAEALRSLLHDPERLQQMSYNAREQAARYSWQVYAEQLVRAATGIEEERSAAPSNQYADTLRCE